MFYDATVGMLETHLETVKAQFVTATPDQFARLQGEAQACTYLLRKLRKDQ